jgi:spore photoproduct lyase
MIQTIYIEQAALEHPRCKAILRRYRGATVITVHNYSEVFNGHKQNFRTQKQSPSLILALKQNTFVHSTPAQYETGGGAHYYFSHMLNCLYDCRYCFLQGMFQSAHYLLFVNYEDFLDHIVRVAKTHAEQPKPTWFFSGYDCDSLAFEPVSQFADFFLDEIEQVPNAVLELRTKSTQIRSLLKRKASDKVVIAASLSPTEVAQAVEHGAPSVSKRIEALQKLQKQGWKIGVRFDPVVWHEDYQASYLRLIDQVFTQLDPDLLDSVTLGSFRVPKTFFKAMLKLYPAEPIFNFGLEQQDPKLGSMVSYRQDIETQTLDFVEQLCLQHVASDKVFTYRSTTENNLL